MKTNKITVFHLTDSSSGSQVARAVPALRTQGGTRPGQDRTPVCPRATHTHPHSDRDNGDTPTDLTCTSSGRGRSLESLEKTHTDVWRTYKPTLTVAPARN